MNVKHTLISAVLTGAVVAGTPALAQDSMLDGWSGSAGLGAVITAGNSDTRNISGSANVTKQTGIWRHTAFGSTYSAENNDLETANRFDLGYKLDRQINELMYGFGRLRYDSDDYGNIDGRFSGVVGVGRQFLDDGKQTLNGEIGIGAHSTDYIIPNGATSQIDITGAPVLDPVTGDPVLTPGSGTADDSGAVLYGGLNYSNILSEILTFNSVFTFEAADSNTYTVWDNSLGVKLSDRISLSLGLLSRSNSDIEGELGEKTDTATRISFVYGI